MRNLIIKSVSALVIVVLITTFFCACSGKQLEKMEFVDEEIVLTEGKSRTLSLLFTPSDINSEKIHITWSSSNNTVAEVENGNVTALSKGETTITAVSDNKIKASCLVKVKDIKITDIQLTESTLSLKKGKTKKLHAIYTPKESNQKLIWSSTDPSVVYVDNDGAISALKKGIAVITCSTEDKVNGSCTVTVTVPKKKKPKPAEQSNYNNNTPNPPVVQPDFVDVKSIVNDIRNSYYSTQKSPGTKTVLNGVSYYTKNGQITKIVVPKGSRGRNYSREYYFKNGQLYFAFVYYGKTQYRFYYYDGFLVRYIGPDKKIVDYPDTKDNEMSQVYLLEAYYIYNEY